MTWPPVPQPPCDPDCSCYEPDPAQLVYTPATAPEPEPGSCLYGCCGPRPYRARLQIPGGGDRLPTRKATT